MICDKHRLNLDVCPHGWNELVSSLEIDDGYESGDLAVECRKMLRQYTFDNIVRNILEKKKYKVKRKCTGFKDLGFSNMDVIADITSNNVIDKIDDKCEYIEIGYLFNLDGQILPPVYAPTVHKLYNYGQ